MKVATQLAAEIALLLLSAMPLSAQPIIPRLTDRVAPVAGCQWIQREARCGNGDHQATGPSRSRWMTGAAVGFFAGGAATYLVLANGGSTAPCNRSANQDAMSAGECLGLTVVGGLVGAGLGALIGSRIRHGVPETPSARTRLLVGPGPLGKFTVGALVRL